MQKKITAHVLLLIAVALVIPQITLAAWWNPLSWNIGRFFRKPIPTPIETRVSPKPSSSITPSTSPKPLRPSMSSKPALSPVFCTQEVKECPDGSFVGRSGSRCEFAKCPTETVSKPLPGATNCVDIKNAAYMNDYVGTLDFCYGDEAIEKKDISICDKLQDRRYKSACQKFVSQKITGDFCDDDAMKQAVGVSFECNASIAWRRQDPTWCEKIGTAERLHGVGNCYRMVAAKLRNTAICDKIVDKTQKQECLTITSVLKNGASYCKKFSGEDLQECRFRAATVGSGAGCLEEENLYSRGHCIIAAVNKNGDISLCEKILPGYEFFKNDTEVCYLNAARKTKNSFYCSKITHPDLKESCNSATAQ